MRQILSLALCLGLVCAVMGCRPEEDTTTPVTPVTDPADPAAPADPVAPGDPAPLDPAPADPDPLDTTPTFDDDDEAAPIGD